MNALKSHKFFWTVILLLFLCALIPVEPLGAAIKPEEIVIIVNSRSADSMRIGKLYSRLRNVPSSHIISVDVPLKDSISRKRYERSIAGPVRKAVTGLYNEGKEIRCIVTTYGIPLRVGMMKQLIYPEEKISKYSRLLKEKEKKLSVLKKKGKDSQPDIDWKEIKRKIELKIREYKFELGRLQGRDTAAAVDSELALLFAMDHQLTGWIPNPLFLFNRERDQNFIGRIFMVSRLDAPTPALAEGLVRTAIEVEQTGLSGKVYLDARGKTGKDAYGRFDEDIRRTAQILRKGDLPVVLDNNARLFRRGEAPSAALYCGWYSHKKYVDAFEWSKGAVGYHVASSEAVSLHDPKRKYWVKSMIEKGVIGSIGPVSEPYLTAFPPPSLFFPLLMSGKYTLVEVFAMTNPYLSWRMILVGDPLYNPFKNNPAFVIEDPLPPPD